MTPVPFVEDVLLLFQELRQTWKVSRGKWKCDEYQANRERLNEQGKLGDETTDVAKQLVGKFYVTDIRDGFLVEYHDTLTFYYYPLNDAIGILSN